MTTATATVTYRKTKAGEWVCYGPAKHLKAALSSVGGVQVTKRDGTTKTETLASVGKGFQVDGTTMAYGYLTAREASRNYDGSARSRYQGGSRRSCISGGDCSSFGSGRSCGAHDCDGY